MYIQQMTRKREGRSCKKASVRVTDLVAAASSSYSFVTDFTKSAFSQTRYTDSVLASLEPRLFHSKLKRLRCKNEIANGWRSLKGIRGEKSKSMSSIFHFFDTSFICFIYLLKQNHNLLNFPDLNNCILQKPQQNYVRASKQKIEAQIHQLTLHSSNSRPPKPQEKLHLLLLLSALTCKIDILISFFEHYIRKILFFFRKTPK